MHRRSVLTALAASGALVTLSACGGEGDGAGAGSSAPAASSAPGGASGAFPVTVEHKLGSTEVAAAPERVVTVGYNEQDFVLALGVTPVGTRKTLSYDSARRPWAQDLLPEGGIPEVGEAELNLEAIAALQPDLIIGAYSYMEQDLYDQLSAIAPTIADAPGATPEAAATWQEELRVVGRALGRGEQAAALTEQVETDFQDAVDAHPGFAGKTVTVALIIGGQYYLLGAADPRGKFFQDLGFEGNPTEGELSAEQTSVMDTDVLVVLGADAQTFAANGAAAALAVVTEGRTVYMPTFEDDFAGALGFSSPLSLPYAVEQAVPVLAAAADGDTATVPATL
ncbi:ABC transporter substrate-binding protein [Kineococcus indalonis]|uniref:ABC transporter substrate-binding protein n=1 Tax=Kineococcus indalonis TaxID=2696566 RepID=UPI001411F4BE|nr:ABC transporter substrate-binding protein [Kineococcus indalonis]NAZ85366.1 ABC transporter substrate-binding protein [Kineococcus indalonis]